MTRAGAAARVPAQKGKPRAPKEVIEPEASEAVAAKQAAQALARLKVAEASRPKTAKEQREERARRARQAGNQRVQAAKASPAAAEEDAIRERALARRDGQAKSPVKTPTHHPNPEADSFELGKAIAELQPEHIQCRDFGHSWRPYHAIWMPKLNYYEAILKCARCGTERMRLIGARGQILGSKYEYADGYTMKGAGRMSTSDRDQVRLASIRIIEVKDTVQE